MTFSPGAFNNFLNGAVRQLVTWRKRSACPCLSPTSGQADATCPICHGKTHIWAAEVDGVVGITNQTPQKAMAAFGTWEPGDCTFTIPNNTPLYAARQYDRIRSKDSTNPFSEVMIPGQNDHLLGTIVSLSRVFWRSSDRMSLIDGSIPTVDATGAMTFSSNAPPADVPFTVEGVRYDEFFVYKSLASDRNVGISGLPLKLAARKFDLLGR